jgi:BirA family biotin operon repressor/biotin-[acetyl-CoA-carboxylase] ligase
VVIQGRKVGGILSEVVPGPGGERVTIVGIGINLNQAEFPPEIADRAISLHQAHTGTYDPMTVAEGLIERLEELPEPDDWSALSPIWSAFDRTPGKRYKLASGQEAVAVAIGSSAQLLCSVAGESQTVMAADAIFGDSVPH